jgi:predicted transcriptional regulator of viral defense system
METPRHGVFRTQELARLGVSRPRLARLVASGRAERVARGLYRFGEHTVTESHSIALASKRVPSGIVCLLSALTFHHIGTQLPHQVWLAIPSKGRTPKVPDLPIRIVRFSGAMLRYGVETRTVEGVEVRVTSPARTVVDCFRFRRTVGLDVALEALREALRGRRATRDQIRRAAEACRAITVVRPYLEAVS